MTLLHVPGARRRTGRSGAKAGTLRRRPALLSSVTAGPQSVQLRWAPAYPFIERSKNLTPLRTAKDGHPH